MVSKLKLTVPTSFGVEDTTSVGTLPWKLFYRDTTLLEHLTVALQSNRDVRIARENTTLAGITLGMVNKNFLPTADFHIGSSVNKFGDYSMDGVGNDDTNRSETLPADQRLPDPYREWFAGITFSWEADIWGKLSSRRKAAQARYLASQEFAHAASTWVVSAVAEQYFELIGLDQERKVLQENIKIQELGLELIQVQKLGGKVNQLAVDQFEAQLLNTRAHLIGVEQKIQAHEAHINELLGRFARSVSRSSIEDYDTLQRMVIGSPAELIRNRPDVREAELELAAVHADVNAAKAAFYPSLSLTGNGGFGAFDLSKWFVFPASGVYGLAAGISAPLFQQKQIRALYASANTRQRIALANYEKEILSGYYEVYVAMNALQNQEKQIDIKQKEVDVLLRAFSNLTDLFSVGYANYLEVITAQRRMLEARIELTQLKKTRLKTIAVLYRALGGGWKE